MKYRDKIQGVVGTAVSQREDVDRDGVTVVLLQLELEPQHLDDTPDTPKGHQLRWYPLTRLEEVE